MTSTIQTAPIMFGTKMAGAQSADMGKTFLNEKIRFIFAGIEKKVWPHSL